MYDAKKSPLKVDWQRPAARPVMKKGSTFFFYENFSGIVWICSWWCLVLLMFVVVVKFSNNKLKSAAVCVIIMTKMKLIVISMVWIEYYCGMKKMYYGFCLLWINWHVRLQTLSSQISFSSRVSFLSLLALMDDYDHYP